ncbi:MAG: flagellar hook protein FlgE [Bdellovibrionota bacterium]
MGIAQALYTGVTGLSVNADGMSVIANNIANSNSKGFKRDRAEFEDLLSSDLSSGAGSAQIGRGSRLRDVKTVHTQGGLKVTDSITDLAIQGNGFFVVSNPNTEVQESAGAFFTRTGSLHFDKDGYLADAGGGRIQGYMADGDGLLSTRLTDVNIATSNIPPRATNKVNLNVQLDSRLDRIEEEFDINNPVKTSNWSTSFRVFDSHGRAHQSTVYFRRLDAGEDGISWEYHAVVDSKEVTDPDDGPWKEFGSGIVRFDRKGQLVSEEAEEAIVNFNNGAFSNQKILFDFGKNIGEEGGNGTNASVSIASKSNTVFHSQDGYESGNLKSLNIGLDGKLNGVFTNGIQRTLAAVALATFENQNGLQKAGRNQFFATLNSGPAKIGMAQTGSRGSLYASSLEESNVDLAAEFVNMILTQRMFQANSRSITTTDTMIEEVINLKR